MMKIGGFRLLFFMSAIVPALRCNLVAPGSKTPVAKGFMLQSGSHCAFFSVFNSRFRLEKPAGTDC